MAAVRTPMSISALLNPQQHHADIHTRQQVGLSLRQTQVGDTNNIHHHRQDAFEQEEKSLSQSKEDNGQKQARNSTGSYRCERYGSVSSTSSITVSERRRAPRPKYTDEEMYFIWYHRVDLDEEWRDCTEAFNKQFPGQGRSERNTQGIQCKFYRFINAKKCPTVREQRRLKDGEFMACGRGGRSTRERLMPQFGVVEWCHVWYPWMKAEHAISGLHPGPPLHASESQLQHQHQQQRNHLIHGNRNNQQSSGDKIPRTYSRSSISSSPTSVLSSEDSDPEPHTPSSYSDDMASEDEMIR